MDPLSGWRAKLARVKVRLTKDSRARAPSLGGPSKPVSASAATAETCEAGPRPQAGSASSANGTGVTVKLPVSAGWPDASGEPPAEPPPSPRTRARKQYRFSLGHLAASTLRRASSRKMLSAVNGPLRESLSDDEAPTGCGTPRYKPHTEPTASSTPATPTAPRCSAAAKATAAAATPVTPRYRAGAAREAVPERALRDTELPIGVLLRRHASKRGQTKGLRYEAGGRGAGGAS